MIETMPAGYALSNYPNPSNPHTTIAYTIPENAHVRLSVIDALGREAALLVDQEKPAGVHQVFFDGKRFPSGVYLCRLIAEHTVISTKFVLVK